MNKKAQKGVLGFALLAILFVLAIAAFATIEPFKETLDNARNSTSLNCPGTAGFNQTDYDDDSTFERLVKRPTCFITGLGLVYFIFAFLIAAVTWMTSNWRRIKQ